MSEYSSSDNELVSNLQKVVVTHLKKRGTREQVWNGEAHSTSGGLTRQDLMISNTGKIVSKKASEKSFTHNILNTSFAIICAKLWTNV